MTEQFLDESLLMGDDYILEVSSPGLSRPLKLPRQFKKNIGREVTMTNSDKTKTVGILTQADDENFQITRSVTRKEGKKKDYRRPDYHSALYRRTKSTDQH